MKKMFAVVLVAALLLPAASFARDVDNDWGTVRSIPPGQLLTIKTFSGKSVKGLFQQATDSAISINSAGKDVEISATEVSRVYILRGKPILKSTLIGAGVGTAAGAGLGAIAGRDSGKDFSVLSQADATAAGAGIGLVAGTLVGLAIGASRNNRVLVYKAAPVR